LTSKVLLNIISDFFLDTNNIFYSNLTAGWWGSARARA